MKQEKLKTSVERAFAMLRGQKISVIIPTRNEEKLLPGCLKQFTAELKSRFGMEIVVSDGGSSDATLAIAAEFADRIATHGKKSRRQTIAEGRNRGAALATGEIFVFLNADTRIPNIVEFFDRIVMRMSVDPSLSALAVKVEVLPEERKFSDRIFHGFFNLYVHYLNLFGIGMGRGECQIVTSTAFNSLHGYDATLAAGEDFEFYKRIHYFGKLKYDGKLLVYESPRRYRKYGYLKVYAAWIKNGFSVLFRNRSVSKVWEEVR
ncbi:MAG: glycosyltransferase [Candidatus Kapaibacterium sp.]